MSAVAFASYFDVYSHAHIFIGVDPWWNPAHVLLYAGFALLAYGVVFHRPKDHVGQLAIGGLALVVASALFNEAWHRVLLFGNPIPEPFPIEPPHALLALGIVILGVAYLIHPLNDPSAISDRPGRLAATMIGGSLWLVIAGSAFYVGGAYGTISAYLFAVGAGSFSASLFIAYPTAIAGEFGYSTISYLWFLFVYYIFFLSPSKGLPLGLLLVVALDFTLARVEVVGVKSRLLALPAVALLYGVVYYPILPSAYSLALNAATVASIAGVAAEYGVENLVGRRLSRVPSAPLHPSDSVTDRIRSIEARAEAGKPVWFSSSGLSPSSALSPPAK